MIKEISLILSSVEELSEDKRSIPPTLLYNEGWLLRLVLSWFSKNTTNNNEISFFAKSRWYSEALLSSPFLPIRKDDNLAETWTHTDGVIGNFKIGGSGVGDLEILKECEQFVVIEAKMYSKFSKGTKNAPSYNQAARTLACMSHTITKDKIDLSKIKNLCFFVMLPDEQMKKEKTFGEYTKKENVLNTVKERIETYANRSDYQGKKKWFDNSFQPFLEKVKINLITWESVIKVISKNDIDYGKRISTFYDKCIKFNRRETD